MKNNKLTKNSVSIAGEFAVLSQLALHGYDANMTLGNTKSIDILASAPRGPMLRLEVKTARTGKPGKYGAFKGTYRWPLQSLTIDRNPVKRKFCFVILEDENKHTRFFIVPERIVAKYSESAHKRWLAANKKHNDSAMRNFRLGQGIEKFKVIAPLVKKYEVWN